jgi:two-component system, chemotaxis family, response regulator PixG
MTTVISTPMTEPADNRTPISNFTSAKQIKLFQTLKQSRMCGQLSMTAAKGECWDFFLVNGEITYATGGLHPVRRWRRNAKIHLSETIASFKELPYQIKDIKSPYGWEYEYLFLLMREEEITFQQADNFIWAAMAEIFFDMLQAAQVVCQFTPIPNLTSRFTPISPEEVIAKADKLWQTWQNAKVADRTPNIAPNIKQLEQIQQNFSPLAYQQMKLIFNGENTIRDLSWYLKKDPLEIILSILDYIQIGWLEVNEIPDLPTPEIAANSPIPLIACVDDSPMFCYVLEQVVAETGYRFFSIQNPLTSVATLLEKKPDLLFLDVIMPHLNGYNVCEQLRKHPSFRNVPIVFLTSSDGLVDRMKAKMVGASGFLSKNVDAATCIKQINRYLKHFHQQSN